MTETKVVVIGLETLAVRPGGLNRYVDGYVAALRRAGLHVEVVALGAPGIGPQDQRALSLGVLERVRLMTRAWRRHRDAEVLDVHFALYGLLPALLRRRSTRLVVHFHGPWAAESAVEGERSLGVRGKAALEKMLYRRAQTVVVLSEAFGKEVEDRYGVRRERVRVIPGGVDTMLFSPGDPAEAKATLGIDPEVTVVALVRRLVARMGHEVAFDALEALKERPLLLGVGGDGPLRAELEAQVARRGLSERVRFFGALEDAQLVELYRAASVSVVPSLAYEGFGLVALESLATATPVVASKVGGLHDLLAPLDPDSVVAPGDGAQLAHALERILDGGGASPEACRRFALDRSWDGVARAHLRLLDPATTRRVLYLGHGARLSGGELALLRQLPALDAVDPLVVLGEFGPLVDELRNQGIEVKVLEMDPGLLETRKEAATLRGTSLGRVVAVVRYLSALRQLIADERPDLIHTNTLKAALLGGIAGRLTGVKVVWHLRDRIADDYLPPSTVLLVRLASRLLPSGIVANSSATLETLGLGPRRVVIPSPVDPGAHPGPRGDGPFTVAMVGRLSPWKGQDLFLEAFAQAFPDGDARAVLIGDALFGEHDYVTSLHELVEALGIEDRVDFLGFRRDVTEQLWRCDLQVVASRVPEPFGNVVLEAMATRTAVIAPRAGGPAELIDDGRTGLLVEPDDVDALAAAMERLWADPGERAQLANAALAEVSQFRAEVLAQRYQALYDQVCTTRRHR